MVKANIIEATDRQRQKLLELREMVEANIIEAIDRQRQAYGSPKGKQLDSKCQ